MEIFGKKRKEGVIRGGCGEPYCSEKCYNEAGVGIGSAYTKGINGTCGFCQSPVRFGPNTSVTNCVAFPHKGRAETLFVCTKCFDKSKKYVREMKQCCMCGKPV